MFLYSLTTGRDLIYHPVKLSFSFEYKRFQGRGKNVFTELKIQTLVDYI